MKNSVFLADVLLPCEVSLKCFKINLTYKLYSHACFHSSVVLLLRATQNLAFGYSRDLALENLSYVRTCLLALRVCREQDIVAIQLDHIISPIYQHLNRVASESVGLMSSQIDNSDRFALPPLLDDVICRLLSTLSVSFKELWV